MVKRMSANRPRARRSWISRSVRSYGSACVATTTSRPSSAPSRLSSSAVMRGFCPRDGRSMKAVRIHEDGGPEVLVIDEVPDPEPQDGEVLVALRAAALNHLDLWIRKGLPSVQK